MSLTSLSTLATLNRTGARRITELAIVEGVTQPSMTAIINRLEQEGLVVREQDPSDQRAAFISLTPDGRDTLIKRGRLGAEALASLIDLLDAKQRTALERALPALVRLRELDDEQRETSRR